MKNFALSKMLWLGLLTALLPWLDQVKASLALDPKAQVAASVLGGLIMALRLVTTKGLTMGKGDD